MWHVMISPLNEVMSPSHFGDWLGLQKGAVLSKLTFIACWKGSKLMLWMIYNKNDVSMQKTWEWYVFIGWVISTHICMNILIIKPRPNKIKLYLDENNSSSIHWVIWVNQIYLNSIRNQWIPQNSLNEYIFIVHMRGVVDGVTSLRRGGATFCKS